MKLRVYQWHTGHYSVERHWYERWDQLEHAPDKDEALAIMTRYLAYYKEQEEKKRIKKNFKPNTLCEEKV